MARKDKRKGKALESLKALNYKKLNQLGLPLIIMKFLIKSSHKFYVYHLSLKLMKEHISKVRTNAGKKRGRGKAKGINAGDDEIEVEIYDGKIITPKATREITILFHQKLNGAWTTFTKYPNSELETLYAQYRAQRFKHK
ncbi:hypothetical protein ACB092_02G192100 [Castanea dentata]